MGTVNCPAAPVRRIVVEGGDGQDFVGVRTVGTSVATLHQLQLDLAVPVELHLGAENDHGHAINGAAPVTMIGGDGTDGFASAGSGDTVIDGGPGEDDYGWAPPPSAPEMPAPASGRVTFNGGAGNDRVILNNVAGNVVVNGGDGDDSLTAHGTSGSTRLSGGAGKDFLSGTANTGTEALDGGDGDDTFRVSRADIDDPVVRGGITTASGGAGRDRFKVGPDGDRDVIDCGAGDDEFQFLTQEQTAPPNENEYRSCPAIGVRIPGQARLGARGTHRTVTVTVHSPRRGTATLELYATPGHSVVPRRVATLRQRLAAGSNRIRFIVRGRNARLISRRGGRQPFVLAIVRIPLHDVVTLARDLRLRA